MPLYPLRTHPLYLRSYDTPCPVTYEAIHMGPHAPFSIWGHMPLFLSGPHAPFSYRGHTPLFLSGPHAPFFYRGHMPLFLSGPPLFLSGPHAPFPSGPHARIMDGALMCSLTNGPLSLPPFLLQTFDMYAWMGFDTIIIIIQTLGHYFKLFLWAK